MTLESQLSSQAIAVPQPMPFAVDFKDRTSDRLHRHVTFPGTDGVYRIRTVNTGRLTESTVVQRHADTALPLETVEGQIFRIKGVLHTPDLGVSESYWLTLNQNQSDEAARLNQYRIRGISLEKWRSDWVYSELRTDENELVVYDMLYDILDLVLSVRDNDIGAFLTLMASDAFRLFADSERAAPIFMKEANEIIEHGMMDEVKSESIPTVKREESVKVVMQELFQQIGKYLKQEFTESFMASSKEFSELLKMYRVKDRMDHEYGDLATLIFQAFLEERIEKVVKKATIEVLAENEGNQQIYLEGEFELDVRAELLRSAYDLMPKDRFIMNLNSTVQLIIGPAAAELYPYDLVENIRQQARFFRNEIAEVATASPVEEWDIFMRLLVEDLYLPYLLIDQRFLQVYMDLKDDAKKDLNVGDGIVEFDLDTPEGYLKHMLIRDIAKELIISDEQRTTFYSELVDRLLTSQMDNKRTAVIDYHFSEMFDVLSDLGEHAQHRLRKIAQAVQESTMVDLKDVASLHQGGSVNYMEQLQVRLGEQALFSTDSHVRLTDAFTFDVQDQAFVNPLIQAYAADLLDLSINDDTIMSPEIQRTLSESTNVQMVDRISRHEDLSMLNAEMMTVDSVSSINPFYKLHPSDSYHRVWGEKKLLHINSQLYDRYQLKGREIVRYVLGDVSKDGWPVGNFILGVNTLK